MRRLLTWTAIGALGGVLSIGGPARAEEEQVPEDVADVPCQDLRAGKDEHKRYFLIGDTKKVPSKGFGLAVVMPGGPGDASFNPFIRRMYKHAFKEKGYLVAQLVAKKWTPNQVIVWPTEKNKVKKMKFSTEKFAETVVDEVSKAHEIDEKRIFTLTWSSSGMAAYAISLTNKKVRGSFIAMSVFKRHELPSLKKAKGHAYYLLHSPDDKKCPYRMAQEAAKQLKKKGAKTKLVDYSGGHGWNFPIYPGLKTGFTWLEKQTR
jgi:predicted esterase